MLLKGFQQGKEGNGLHVKKNHFGCHVEKRGTGLQAAGRGPNTSQENFVGLLGLTLRVFFHQLSGWDGPLF